MNNPIHVSPDVTGPRIGEPGPGSASPRTRAGFADGVALAAKRIARSVAEWDLLLRRRPELRRRWLGSIGLLGGISYLVRLGSSAFWRDEVASVEIARRPLGDLLQTLNSVDAVHGFYYVLLHYWLQVSTSETWVRLLSALCAVGTVVLVAELGRRRLGVLAGTTAAVLVLGNPFFSYYAQEARGYTLAACLVAGAAMCLLGGPDPAPARRLVGFWACATAAVYANLFALLAVAGLLAGLVIRHRRQRTARLVLTCGAVVACSVPLLLVAARQSGMQSWIGRPGLRDAAAAARDLIGSDLTAVVAYLLLALVVLQNVRSCRQESGRSAVSDAVLLGVPTTAGAIAIPIALFVVSWLRTPIYVERYMVASIPLAALGLVALIRFSQRYSLFCALLIVLGVVGTVSPVHSRLEDLRAAAAYVRTEAVADDCIVFDEAWSRPGLDYYLRSATSAHPEIPRDVAVLAGGRSAIDDHNLYAREGGDAEVANALRACPRVWQAGYVDSSSWTPVPNVGATAFATVRSAYVESTEAGHRFGTFQIRVWVRDR